MKTKVCHLALVSACLLLASNCLAQKVPVVIPCPTYATNPDETITLRFCQSLEDEVMLSSRFYPFRAGKILPPNLVIISLNSVHVKVQGGGDVGVAICVEAERQSNKEPEYHKVILSKMMMIPKDSSVAIMDDTRDFLADVARAVDKAEITRRTQ